MTHTFYLTPACTDAGLTTLSLGMVRALERLGVRVGFFKPIGQLPAEAEGPERSTHFIRENTGLPVVEPVPLAEAERMLTTHRSDELMGRIVQGLHQAAVGADLVIVEGLVPTVRDSHVGQLNLPLIQALDAQVILAGSAAGRTAYELSEELELAIQGLGPAVIDRLIGVVINQVPVQEGPLAATAALLANSPLMQRPGFALLGAVPREESLLWPRAADVARVLRAEILHAGEMQQRRVQTIHLLARTVPNMLHTFRPGRLLVTPADRDDVLMAVALAAMKKVPMAGLVLTGDQTLNREILDFTSTAWESGLPVFRVQTDSFSTASALTRMSDKVPADDIGRMTRAMDLVASHLVLEQLRERLTVPVEVRVSPAAFFHRLTDRAVAANRRILLPEGEEPRTIDAAATCQRRGIARCVLLGSPGKIRETAAHRGILLPEGLEIMDPEKVRRSYVPALTGFRRSKGLSAQAAADQLTDNVVLGTVMLALGEADGLVSGAVHSSANTIRPALQIIKTRPGARVVSSIFFMCLPDEVVVYGDCAVNTDPDAATLADIAMQSADSAERFGIPARVAMISYSTGESGSGADVEKVREATRLIRERRPDLLVDGPLQYDAAAIAEVAATKAPGSPVAGRATVFIFPDLNTGNTTYKAVQRSANVVSIGPMLQGLKRPVNDLSRGALVEDIVYTIALTAIQADDNVEVPCPPGLFPG